MKNRQRGSAMLVTLIIVTALLGGSAVLVAMQLSSNRSADLSRTGLSALYCAEAGLAAAQPVVQANMGSWNGSLYVSGTPVEPAWLYAGITTAAHDLDGDGVDDYMVYLKDDDDEIGTNDPTTDINQRIYIVSRCIKYADTVKEVEELVMSSGGGNCYHSQLGNCFNNGNGN